MVIARLIAALCALALPVAAFGQTDAAQRHLASDYDRVIGEIIAITEIPAPPFAESARAKFYADQLRSAGLADVQVDAIGNVTGLRLGKLGKDAKIIVISAHLDTVFPADTNVIVRREGDRLFAPGIGDDSLGLASILAWARALNGAKIETTHDILFVGTVGEEGKGDLRGARFLHSKSAYRDRIAAFVTVDGTDPAQVVHQAVGSKRYRVDFTGPGGHSYGAFGIVNPMAAMADTVAQLYTISVPATPKTSYAASVVSGGTSVNAIPAAVALEIDLRSVYAKELARLDRRLLAIVDAAVASENHARSTAQGAVSATKTVIGDRPAGLTAADHPLVVAAQSALARQGITARLHASSTDANIAMSMGIPALAIGSGAGGGRAHALDEYLDIGKPAFQRGLAAGLDFVIAAANLDYSEIGQ